MLGWRSRVAALAAVLGLGPRRDPAAVPRCGDGPLGAALARLVARHRLPALAGAIVGADGLRAAAVAGWRKAGDPTPATLDDPWHLGSNTKAMTAVLAARAVERGRLRWDSTVAEVLPTAGPGWERVTLDHLLVHRGGIAADPDFWTIPDTAAAVRAITAAPPATDPGTVFAYRNAGYVLAGAMLEQAAGRPWPDLIRDGCWAPLGMAGAGLGGMGRPGLLDAPWAHRRDGTPAGNGPDMDNPPVMDPAGRAHMPLAAWAAFIADQLRGARGRPALLGPASYRHLHDPWPGGDDARGWLALTRSWARGRVLTHTGSNTLHVAVAWVAPAIDRALLVCTNQGGSEAACDRAVGELLAHPAAAG